MNAPTPDRRLPLVDGLKAGACLLIVLHHLAFYGPMADRAAPLFPSLFGGLADQGRLAVQVFLVVGGWLAARAWLADGGAAGETGTGSALARRIVHRYLRLAVPLWVALVVAVVCNAVADVWMDHHAISGPPSVLQIAAHVLLLQDVTGHEALSAGVWYVAIDFQLHVMLAFLAAWAARRAHPVQALALVTFLLLVVSAFVLNRDADWDVAAPYFWVSYGLGVLVALSPARAGPPSAQPATRWILALAFIAVMTALIIDFRERLLVAMATAVLLWVGPGVGALASRAAGSGWRAISGLSRISYSVFLVHFPISLVVNALWSAHVPHDALLSLLGVVTAVKLSLLGGWAFHEGVERVIWPPIKRLERRWDRRTLPSA